MRHKLILLLIVLPALFYHAVYAAPPDWRVVTYSDAIVPTTTTFCPEAYSIAMSNYYSIVNNMFFMSVNWSEIHSMFPCHPVTMVYYTHTVITIIITPSRTEWTWPPMKTAPVILFNMV